MLLFFMTIADEQYRPQIERLFKRYHNEMMRVAKKAFRAFGRQNPGLDAEDAVQSTFGSIVRYAHAVPFDRPEAELRAYIYAILHHEIEKIMEEPEQAFAIDSSELPDRESLPEFGERLHVREQYDEVVAFIREMDPKYSTVLLLYFAEELTGEQIAKLLEISKYTVYTRLHRGKQQLLDRFGKGEDT